MKKQIFKLAILALVALFYSCEKEEIKEVEVEVPKIVEEIAITETSTFNDGIWVSAEGNFGSKDGTISYINDSENGIANFAYQKVNDGTPLAGLIQSVTFSDDKAYVILNDVATIVIVDKTTLKKEASITMGLNNPRYMTIIGDKAYVTNWGSGLDETDDFVAVINLTTNTVEDTISLANGVEQILNKDNKLYVSHKGAWSTNDIVSVVDLGNSNAVTTIKVKEKPDEMFFSEDGQLIVLSSGRGTKFQDVAPFAAIERTAAAIQFIDLSTEAVVKELAFNENEGAELLAYEGGELYYNIGSKIYTIDDAATALSADTGLEVGDIYGLNVRDNKLYTVSFAFTSFSELKIRSLDSGSLIFSEAVGLGASKIYFQ